MTKMISACLLMVFGLVVSGGAFGTGQDSATLDKLKEPRIVSKPNQKMLVVEVKGDPNVSGSNAFSLLFRTFFSLPGVRMAPPRARWLAPLSAPKTEWVGLCALPLPESVTELPAGVEGVKIEVWEYGEVAEIFHPGAYGEEAPTIEKLMAFIKAQGYEIAGPHEEEYIIGPGMGADPKDYKTIIRYQVKRT